MELLLYLNVADHITSSSLAKGGVAKGHDEHAEDVQEEHQRVKVADVAELRVNQLKMKDANAFKVHNTIDNYLLYEITKDAQFGNGLWQWLKAFDLIHKTQNIWIWIPQL